MKSEYLASLATPRPTPRRTEEHRRRWSGWEPSAPVTMKPAPGVSPFCCRWTVTFSAPDGTILTARYLTPLGEGPFPSVLTFHDDGRPVRGWHHLMRYPAVGFAVLALSRREGSAEEQYEDALVAAHALAALPQTDTTRLMASGEGFGGTLALVAATLWKGAQVSVYNPVRGVGETDLCLFAQDIIGDVQLATGFLSQRATVEDQFALFHSFTCHARHLYFPKHGEELNNFYENEALRFFLSPPKGMLP